jgi:putative addiction module component (TIGR02574 family)
MKKNITMNTQYVQLNIPLSFKQVVDIVRQLSPSEKQQLSEVLWTELNIEDIVIPEEHKQIVRKRIKKYENKPDTYLSWDEIERKLAARK